MMAARPDRSGRLALEQLMDAPLTPAQRQGNWIFANSLALLVLRLVLGWIFIYAGSQKLFGAFDGMGMETWIKVMDSMHMPELPATAWAYISACGEFFGGIAVLLGLLTRLASLPLIATMCVAIAKAIGQNGFGGKPSMIDPGAVHPGYAYNLALIAISVALLLTGGGLISLDVLIFKRSLWARGPQPLDRPEKPA
jgi:putative oxidoreductase